MFRHRLVTGLLVLGVFFGFGSGIASVVHHGRGGCASSWHEDRMARMEQRFARACVDAARSAPPGAPSPRADLAPAAAPQPGPGYYAAPQWGPPPGWGYAPPAWAIAPGYALPPAPPAPAAAVAPPAQP